MLSIIGRPEPPRVIELSAAHKIVQIIARTVYCEVRAPFFRITRTGIFYTLPTSRRMLISAGAVAPQYELASIVYNDAITAITVSLKESASELRKLVELLFFSNTCHNL